MGKFVKALTVAAMLAAAMLASGAEASADGGKGTKPAPAPAGITWEASVDLGGASISAGITWE